MHLLQCWKASISLWSQQGKKGVWIKLRIGLANLVEAAARDFGISSCRSKTHLIPKTPHAILANASRRVAFVVNDKGEEFLIVHENNGKFKGTGVWKFPSGVVHEGEEQSWRVTCQFYIPYKILLLDSMLAYYREFGLFDHSRSKNWNCPWPQSLYLGIKLWQFPNNSPHNLGNQTQAVP